MPAQRVLDPRERKFQRAVREFCISNGVPGGPKGLYTLIVAVPVLVYLTIRTFGFVTSLFYSIPIGIIGAIIYAERSMAAEDQKED